MIRLFNYGICKRHISEHVGKIVKASGFTKLYPVQTKVIQELEENPHINIVVKSATGSGKTLAYLIPAISNVLSKPYEPGTEILIVVPTRDLAVQVMKHLNVLFQHTDFEKDWMSFCGVITGGRKRKQNLFFLHKYPKILVGTCGVLTELLTEGVIPTHNIDMVILDEIDQTVKMGYNEDLMAILNFASNAQIMGFSATATNTVTTQIEKISGSKFKLLNLNEDELTNVDIHHYSILMANNRTLDNVVKIISDLKHMFLGINNDTNTLIFCQKRLEVDALGSELRAKNLNTFNNIYQIHADFKQDERNKVMTAFQNGGNNLLIGTSAMARGMDLPLVDLVIHMGTRQHSAEEYIHSREFEIIDI